MTTTGKRAALRWATTLAAAAVGAVIGAWFIPTGHVESRGARTVASPSEGALYVAWIAWIVSWEVAAVWSSRAQTGLGFGKQWPFRLLTQAGFLLVLATPPFPWRVSGLKSRFDLQFVETLTTPLWSTPEALGWVLAGVAAAGFLFAWWARIHLGKLWSSAITRKADHRIVDTGPYGLVRHPIYTGILMGGLALGLDKATPAAIAGIVALCAGYWLKGRMEEGFLRAELGAQDYDAYSRRVPMLVPFLPAKA